MGTSGPKELPSFRGSAARDGTDGRALARVATRVRERELVYGR